MSQTKMRMMTTPSRSPLTFPMQLWLENRQVIFQTKTSSTEHLFMSILSFSVNSSSLGGLYFALKQAVRFFCKNKIKSEIFIPNSKMSDWSRSNFFTPKTTWGNCTKRRSKCSQPYNSHFRVPCRLGFLSRTR